MQNTNVSQAGGVEAQYPNSFGCNPRPSPASMTSFGLKFMPAINIVSWVPFWGGGGASTLEFGYSPSPPPPQKKKKSADS